jgi:hypothetical protein
MVTQDQNDPAVFAEDQLWVSRLAVFFVLRFNNYDREANPSQDPRDVPDGFRPSVVAYNVNYGTLGGPNNKSPREVFEEEVSRDVQDPPFTKNNIFIVGRWFLANVVTWSPNVYAMFERATGFQWADAANAPGNAPENLAARVIHNYGRPLKGLPDAAGFLCQPQVNPPGDEACTDDDDPNGEMNPLCAWITAGKDMSMPRACWDMSCSTGVWTGRESEVDTWIERCWSRWVDPHESLGVTSVCDVDLPGMAGQLTFPGMRRSTYTGLIMSGDGEEPACECASADTRPAIRTNTTTELEAARCFNNKCTGEPFIKAALGLQERGTCEQHCDLVNVWLTSTDPLRRVNEGADHHFDHTGFADLCPQFDPNVAVSRFNFGVFGGGSAVAVVSAAAIVAFASVRDPITFGAAAAFALAVLGFSVLGGFELNGRAGCNGTPGRNRCTSAGLVFPAFEVPQAMCPLRRGCECTTTNDCTPGRVCVNGLCVQTMRSVQQLRAVATTDMIEFIEAIGAEDGTAWVKSASARSHATQWRGDAIRSITADTGGTLSIAYFDESTDPMPTPQSGRFQRIRDAEGALVPGSIAVTRGDGAPGALRPAPHEIWTLSLSDDGSAEAIHVRVLDGFDVPGRDPCGEPDVPPPNWVRYSGVPGALPGDPGGGDDPDWEEFYLIPLTADGVERLRSSEPGDRDAIVRETRARVMLRAGVSVLLFGVALALWWWTLVRGLLARRLGGRRRTADIAASVAAALVVAAGAVVAGLSAA